MCIKNTLNQHCIKASDVISPGRCPAMKSQRNGMEGGVLLQHQGNFTVSRKNVCFLFSPPPAVCNCDKSRCCLFVLSLIFIPPLEMQN